MTADREFESLIKGGFSNYQIDFSTEPVRSLTSKTDILVALDEQGIDKYIGDLKEGGILIHGQERHEKIRSLKLAAKEKTFKTLYLPSHEIADSLGGSHVIANMVILGMLWRSLGFDRKILEEEVKERFASKPKILELDLKCLQAAYNSKEIEDIDLNIETPKSIPDTILINGNYSIGLGAIQAGVRNYYAYPMSPASSILSYLAEVYHETGMMIKQAEDEITAAQMSVGSMYAGSRALTSTSGGGFDLMTETISGAAIMEVPLVIVIAQRPGPGTGLPTWTAQGDLNMAIHSSHGEFPRAVLACSDPSSAYEQIQHAMNLAEKFQIPVILLTEKQIAEAQQTVPTFKEGIIPIERGLVTDKSELEALASSDRYKITESGISKRWLPGTSKTYFVCNADEHFESGEVTEEREDVKKIYAKRMRKEEALKDALPEPKIFGTEKDADISFIGWGSSKNVMLDVIASATEEGIKINYLHYEFLWPFKKEAAEQFFKNNKKVCLIEGNYRGQFGQIVEDKTGNKFTEKLLKYDGRVFYCDEVAEFIKKTIN
jgi:2-oxoglutarate ferredoxin oxidoreductase subunit alpha